MKPKNSQPEDTELSDHHSTDVHSHTNTLTSSIALQLYFGTTTCTVCTLNKHQYSKVSSDTFCDQIPGYCALYSPFSV